MEAGPEEQIRCEVLFMEITQKFWGTFTDGSAVYRYKITNKKGNSVTVTNLGGIITSIMMPDASGVPGDVVLGYDSMEEYIKDDGYLGAMIGRFSNRIANGTFQLNGKTWNLTKNQSGNTLHGGGGIHKKLWKATPTEDGLLLQCKCLDGEDGFPGELHISILCSLSEDNCLTLDMKAVSDQDTVCSLTNHSYFNLASRGDILSHQFQICAEKHTPLTAKLLPEGTIRPVEGTEYDFREKKPLPASKFDANYVLTEGYKPCAVVTEETSGRTMTVFSDLPAMQFYAGGGLTSRRGKGGSFYGPNSGFCLEPQFYPDSPNISQFPSAHLKEGEEYHRTICYQFSVI